ncbi:hypothetical protein GGS21DRAFT_302788 [Xylaria nigripes]|nr:hypothetical protein GGS21DRAFT_302788 [Xylaria nigripes]
MASEPKRPPTRTRSGSRPPTSRFQEGSMNDRTSAIPPPQFLGPEELTDYESRFYAEPASTSEARAHRHPRPATAAAQLQATTTHPHDDAQELRGERHHRVTHKKSIGFFGRVRDALFSRATTGGGGIAAAGVTVGGGQHIGQMIEPQEVERKHTSLQESVQDMPPILSRPEYIHAAWAQSEINITQMRPSPRKAVDRPSKEEVEASYYQLMASGFFKAHAIQSTRHAPPKSMVVASQTDPIPEESPIQSPSTLPPNPPTRVSSISAPTRTSTSSFMAPKTSTSSSRRSRDYPSVKAAAAKKTARTSFSSLSSLFTPSIPDLRKKDSRYMLRGRKRARGDGEDTPRTSTTDSNYSFQTSTAYFAQPLRRVAKKLRKAPSSYSQRSLGRISKKAASVIQQPTSSSSSPSSSSSSPSPPPPPATADGIMRLVPSISSGGSLYPNERTVRVRSPSPKKDDKWEGEKTVHQARVVGGTRRPRKTFSYKLREPVRSRERTRERQANRAQRRDSSCDGGYATRHWPRASLEETIIHCDFDDSNGSVTRRDRGQRERQAASTTTMTAAGTRTRRSSGHYALQTMSDANRGIPSAHKVPERWHGSGKAYHLKDRGSRFERTAQWGGDEIRSSKRSSWCGKENKGDFYDVDTEEDDHVPIHHSRTASRDPQPQQWHIGNAL